MVMAAESHRKSRNGGIGGKQGWLWALGGVVGGQRWHGGGGFAGQRHEREAAWERTGDGTLQMLVVVAVAGVGGGGGGGIGSERRWG